MNAKRNGILLLLIAALLATAVVVLAQASADFNLSWHIVAGGGGEAVSADFALNGSAGQSAAAPQQSSAGFALQSGFWQEEAGGAVFMPVVRGP